MQNQMMPKVRLEAIVFLNSLGQRFYAKYYPSAKSSAARSQFDLTKIEGQKRLEKALVLAAKKTNPECKENQEVEVFYVGGFMALVKIIGELQIYVLSTEDENLLVAEKVVTCLASTLTMHTNNKYVGKTIETNMSAIILSADEIADQGLITCLDPTIIYNRVKMKDDDNDSKNKPKPTETKPGASNSAISAPAMAASTAGSALSSIFGFAKNSLQKTLNLG